MQITIAYNNKVMHFTISINTKKQSSTTTKQSNLSNYTRAYDNKGFALGILKKHEEAMKCFDRIIELDPKHIIAYFNKGISLAKLNLENEAISYFDKVIELDSQYVNAYSNKGLLLAKLNQPEEAIK